MILLIILILSHHLKAQVRNCRIQNYIYTCIKQPTCILVYWTHITQENNLTENNFVFCTYQKQVGFECTYVHKILQNITYSKVGPSLIMTNILTSRVIAVRNDCKVYSEASLLNSLFLFFITHRLFSQHLYFTVQLHCVSNLVLLKRNLNPLSKAKLFPQKNMYLLTGISRNHGSVN